MTEDNKKIPQGQHINDDEQWGNIQLPGITDEQLHDRKYQRKLLIKQITSSPLWLAATTAASQRKAQSDAWNQAMAVARLELKNDPVRWAQYLERQAAAHQDPEVRRKKAEKSRQSWHDNLKHDAEFLEKRKARTRATIGRSITTPYGVFDSIVAFAEATGLKPRDKLKLLPHLYYYTDSEPGPGKTEKVYYTPWGYHNGVQWSHKLAIEAQDAEALKKHKAGEWFRKMAARDPENYYVLIETKREWALQGKPAH